MEAFGFRTVDISYYGLSIIFGGINILPRELSFRISGDILIKIHKFYEFSIDFLYKISYNILKEMKFMISNTKSGPMWPTLYRNVHCAKRDFDIEITDMFWSNLEDYFKTIPGFKKITSWGTGHHDG
jgi:hypothetical protein